jgi:hypothetical protein
MGVFSIGVDLEAAIKKYDETVSLGSSCQSAWHLEANGLRRWSYPLDWVITPFDSLIAFITHRGVGFLDRDKIAVIEILEGAPSMLHVSDTTYHIHSIHDFFAPDMPNYEAVKAKYDRRIKRFFDLLESSKRILFVRVNISRQEAEYLDHFLHTLYPRLEYTLLAVSEDPSAQENWGLERVRNFYMQQFPSDWVGNSGQWTEILSQFPIKAGKKKGVDEEKW